MSTLCWLLDTLVYWDETVDRMLDKDVDKTGVC